MLARFLGLIAASRRQIIYVAVITALAGVIEVGHVTRWTFYLAGQTTDTNKSGPRRGTAESEPAPTPVDKSEFQPARRHEIRLTSAEMEKSGIHLDKARRQSMEQMLVAPGVVDYNRNLLAQLSTRVAGNVWRIEKHVGESVKKGDILAVVEAVEVGKVKAEFLQAAVACETKSKTLERMKLVDGSLPERQVREAETQFREAKIQLANVQQTLVNLGLPIRLDEVRGLSDDMLARRVQFLGLPESLVASLDPTTTTANLLPLAAPFDGMVIGRESVVGEVVNPAEPTFVIADISRMWILLEVRKEDANLAHLGQDVAFNADGIPGDVRGKIDWISTEVDQETRTLTVRAEVHNPLLPFRGPGQGEQRLLRARTYGTGRILIRESPQAVVVPSDAVQFDGAKHVVFVREGDLFLRREVQPGTMHVGQTEIVAGLHEGEAVATVGSHVLKAELQLAASRN